MGFCWIGFTLIWITFCQRELTSAASLRSESQDFSPGAIGITKSHIEQNIPIENSNYQNNIGNPKHRFRLPYERRNRQIYTSKIFFGRNQQLELPRKYGINKEDTDTAPLRIKTARYMYPVKPRNLEYHEYDNSAANHDYVIPHLNHQTPIEHHTGNDPNGARGLNPNYNSNLGNIARTEYGLNPEQDPSAGYEHNTQYVNFKYDPRSEQNANVEFGKVPTYQANAEYPEYYAQAGQDSVYPDNSGIVQDLGHDSNVDSELVVEYGPNVRHGQVLEYDPNVRHGQVLEYDPNGPNVGHGQVLGRGINPGNGLNLGYDTNVRNRQDSTFANAGHGQDPGYVNHAQQGQGNGYNAITRNRQDYGYHTNAGYGHVSGQNVNAGYGSNVRENANAGYDSKIEYTAKTYGFELTNNEQSEKDIKSEKVDLKNEEFKHQGDKKEVIQKQGEEKAIDHKLENKEDKEQTYILNDDDHIKILNMYNQLLLSEKRKDSLLNKNTVTTNTASNLNFISDKNLEKDELLRHIPEENTFKQLPSDSVSDEVEVPKRILLEELEGSGNVESFNEDLSTSDQESKKSPRILEIFSRVNASNQCVTPKNESGHCRGLTECPLIETTDNFSTFLQYVCFQKSRLVGICCPDNPVIEISDPLDENSTKQEKADIEQPTEGCGLSTNTRIVGGTMSIPHEFSWMVALLRRGIKVGDLKVRLGEFDFHKTTDHQRDIPVAEIKRHALFVTLTFQHDIALLKLRRKIEYTKFIGSICLPNKDEGDFTARNATVVGWGTVSFGGATSPILRKVTVPVWDNKQCDRTYVFERINEAFMCAGSPESGEDACQGDSGGPLMTMNDDGRWSVIGIVSWGRRCGDPTYPGVYTRVTSYLDWIAENAQ